MLHLQDVTFSDVLDYSMQIAKGIQFLHQKKIVHRALKTSNILVCT